MPDPSPSSGSESAPPLREKPDDLTRSELSPSPVLRKLLKRAAGALYSWPFLPSFALAAKLPVPLLFLELGKVEEREALGIPSES